MRCSLDYLRTLLTYQGETAIASVNLDKFIPKCKVDTISLKKLLNLLHAKIDTTLWFRGKPAPIDHLLEMAKVCAFAQMRDSADFRSRQNGSVDFWNMQKILQNFEGYKMVLQTF